jgi:RNA polymerase sigma factor (sigma-70 family)
VAHGPETAHNESMEAGALPRVGPQMAPALTPRLLRLAPDSRLVGLVRDGRRGAFEALYDRHHKGILSFCRHMLSDADEAEDAVQHTFMAAYSDLMSSEKPIQLRAWLFTIARNRCYSILRARREQPSAEIAEAAGEGLASQVQRRQDLRDLVHDMRQLPEDQRAALLLAELDALSHAEIADVLGVPREKVKALIFQARASLLASRTARDTACAEIREQIACGRGASLRRANLRRHLRECDGCREFRAQVEHQRHQFALFPAVAATGGGVIASSAIKSGLAKGLIGVTLAGVGAAGGLVAAGTSLPIHSLMNLVTHKLSPHPALAIATAPAPRRATPHRSAAHGVPASRATSVAVTMRVEGSSRAGGGRMDRPAFGSARTRPGPGAIKVRRRQGPRGRLAAPAAPAAPAPATARPARRPAAPPPPSAAAAVAPPATRMRTLSATIASVAGSGTHGHGRGAGHSGANPGQGHAHGHGGGPPGPGGSAGRGSNGARGGGNGRGNSGRP